MKTTPHIIVQLVHMQGPFKGEIQEYSGPEIIVGRHSSCQLIFPKDLSIISRKHATISREGNRFKIADHSSNGTFLNGKEVKEEYLKDGDILDFAEGGPKVSFLTQMVEKPEEMFQDITSSPLAEPESSPPVEAPPLPLDPPQAEPPQFQPITPPQSPSPQNQESQPPVSTSSEAPPMPPPVKTDADDVNDDIPVQQVNVPLTIQYGPTLNSFKSLPVELGSGQNCKIYIHHPSVLDRHAQIFFHNDQYWIKDLTGKTLVSINDRPIGLKAPLSPEDQLSLSPSGPKFRFIAGGRLAEIEELPAEEPTYDEPPDQVPEFEESTQKKDQVEKVVKSAKSMIKKLWDR